jgi:hypothetical protein
MRQSPIPSDVGSTDRERRLPFHPEPQGGFNLLLPGDQRSCVEKSVRLSMITKKKEKSLRETVSVVRRRLMRREQ